MNNKIPFLTQLGTFISVLGLSYQRGGIKQAIIYIKSSIRIAVFRYRFNHSEKFRNKVLTNLTVDNLWLFAMIEMYSTNEFPNLGKYVVYLSDEDKEKYIKNILETRKSTIASGTTLTKEQTASLNKMYGLDVLGVKIEDEEEVKPKKTRKKSTKKEKTDSAPTAKVK